jgi:hypothetical protein
MVSPESHEPDPETRPAERPAEELTARQVADALLELGREQAEINRAIVERFNEMDERFNGIEGRFNGIEGRLDKIDVHLGYLRGAHAASAARRNASLIADDMGYQVISRLPREELIGFSNMARAAGKAEDDVRSFREADLVLLVHDGSGQPAYIAVESSFTVASKDINRAKRNAEYLHEFTGLPARGAVAGVDIAPGRERNANAGGVHCYHIPIRDLESD